MASYRLDLLSFLKTGVASISRPLAPRQSQNVVLGNSSADLDSIISAIIYSYFASTSSKQYTPLINLSDVHTGPDLCRLRPEFLAALRFASGTAGLPFVVHPAATATPHKEKSGHQIRNEREDAHLLRHHVLTTADLREVWRQSGSADVAPTELDLNLVLVDWNAPPRLAGGIHGVAGLTDSLPTSINISVALTECVDHHVDEHVVPESASPRWIQPGVGSCTSLVVQDLHQRGLWEDETTGVGEGQAAKLALAAILIDTVNMTDTHKVSDIDQAAVAFLEKKISAATQIQSISAQYPGWDRNSFYAKIQGTKENSIEFLTIPEILARDYKDWVDPVSGKPELTVKIGIASTLRPISWILKKASSANTNLVSFLGEFSKAHSLDVCVIMTGFTRPNSNAFNRELLIYIPNAAPFKDSTDEFIRQGTPKLGLEDWTDGLLADNSGYIHAWKQGDVQKSRKAVAPFIRNIYIGK